MSHKAGFVNIIGNPNVGKSTLMNALVGEKLSIITSKIQTTRHRIMGVISGDDFQIVYSDTPGIIPKPHYKLHQTMMKVVETAVEDADIIVFMTDVYEPIENLAVLDVIKKTTVPVIFVINKVDLSEQKLVEEKIAFWETTLPSAVVVPISALHLFNLDRLFNTILEKLPEGPAYYEKDVLTDRPQRFFSSEIIREKVFELYRKEIPYSTEIQITSFKEEPKITKISAFIFVERENQKVIILGEKGKKIKHLGICARKELEEFLGQHVFLELTVKVNANWRNNDDLLQNFGYEI